jgi:hypothetical protein
VEFRGRGWFAGLHLNSPLRTGTFATARLGRSEPTSNLARFTLRARESVDAPRLGTPQRIWTTLRRGVDMPVLLSAIRWSDLARFKWGRNELSSYQ